MAFSTLYSNRSSDATPCELLSFSHYLTPKVSLQIEPKCGLCTAGAALFERPFRVPSIPSEFSQVFLYSPSKELLDTLSKTHTIQPIQEFSNGPNQLYLVD
jgi:hypothetical protein